MQQHVVERILKPLGMTGTLQPIRALTSAVTTAWGVDWDEVYIARDLMQNFFDANRECLESVLVRNDGSVVVITASAPFNLERLFYLGSEKGDNDIGQYGEGFKVAATCLLRDHKVTPIAVSGWDVVVLRVADRAVADTGLFPVEYDFYRNDREVPGTALVLPGCSGKLAKALAEGLTHFFHDRNALLGAKRWSAHDEKFSIYDSTNGRGHVFYRNLKRGEIHGIPVVLVIDKEYQAIERKISKDRDRNAFGDEVMKLFYKHFSQFGVKRATDAQQVIVMAATSCWENGHPLLHEIAESQNHPWPPASARTAFGEKYYARSARSSNPTEQLEIDRLERRWREDARVSLPGYFRQFGVLCAKEEIRRVQEEATEESKKNNQRSPTTPEQNAIRLLSLVLTQLAPEVIAVFEKGKTRTHYTVVKTEVVRGQLKSGRSYHSREVFLAESVFVSDFPEALATFLHEHAHIFGHDGSRGFTDALTELLETVVRFRRDLDQYETKWQEVSASVQRERVEPAANDEADRLDDWLSAMHEQELRELVARLPPVLLRKLCKN